MTHLNEQTIDLTEELLHEIIRPFLVETPCFSWVWDISTVQNQGHRRVPVNAEEGGDVLRCS